MEKVKIVGGRGGQVLPWIIPEIGSCQKSGGRVILLVPEQYTLQAERELMDRLNLLGMLDLDVLSPSRLKRRILERGGRDPMSPLDEQGRCMALMQTLIAMKPQLGYYGRVSDMPGLTGRLSSLLADMQKADMTPDTLRNHAMTLPEGAARAKELDVALLWEHYLALIDGRFADEIMQQSELVRRLKPSGVMQDVSLWVYGFDVLQQPMCDLLCEAATLTRSLTVTLTMDTATALDGRIFTTQRHSAGELIKRLDAREIPWELRYLPTKDMPDKQEPLRVLESALFTRQGQSYEGNAACIEVHASANPFAEASFAAQTLRAWHDSGIPWQRMAVALADPSSLSGVMAVTLRGAGIPHYLARKDSVLRHGLCRMLLGSLRAATDGFRQQDVLDVVRSGFSTLMEDECLSMLNYAAENGVTRGKWLRPFTRGEDAEAMEALRVKLVEPITRLREELRTADTATASMTAVYHLLERTNAYQTLIDREEQLLQRNMQAEAMQNRQVWQIVLGLMDQLHALLGSRRAAMKDVARFVEAGLNCATVSALPPAPDTVMVGEAGHLMTGQLDALLVMGMQDGVLSSAMDSLLTEEERASLVTSLQRSVGLTRVEQAALRQADFYRTLTLPTKCLTLTYSEGGQDGAALRPAGLLTDLMEIFPQCLVTGGVTADETNAPPLAPLPALDGLAVRLRAMADGTGATLDENWQEAFRWLWQSDRYGERMRQTVAGLDAKVAAGTLQPAQTRRLFGQDSVSISRLERFAACPYRHFIDYGLKPVERRPFEFQADEKGSFFHEALQGYATLASALPDWPNVPDEAVDRMMDQVLAPLEATWEDGPLTADPLGESLGRSYVRTVRRAAWMFTRHARNSRFTTVGAEVRFGAEEGLPPVVLTLHDGRRIALRGVIDRIDRFDGDKGVYLRVVDYKSSQQELDPIRMWYGLQLQLLLYLTAATQGQEGALPAGAFYFTIADPLVDTDEDVKEAAETAIAKKLHLKGVVLSETEVVDAMDADIPGFSLGKVFNADGSVDRNASAMDLDQMHALLLHARRQAAEMADGIREGRIEISPAQIGPWTACEYCGYAAVCRQDPTLPGGEKRVLTEPNKEEFLTLLTNEATRAD